MPETTSEQLALIIAQSTALTDRVQAFLSTATGSDMAALATLADNISAILTAGADAISARDEAVAAASGVDAAVSSAIASAAAALVTKGEVDDAAVEVEADRVAAEAAASAAQVAKIDWQGAWSDATAYALRDGVTHNGASYICIEAHTNQEPPNGTYWDVLAERGTDGVDGEMTGPVGAVVDGHAVVFDGITGSAVKSAGGAPLINPLTTEGDLVVRGAEAAERLAVGTVGLPLVSNGTTPGYAALGLAGLAAAARIADIAFVAAPAFDWQGDDLMVMTYGEQLIGRNITISGLIATLAVAGTGAAVIFDIEDDGVSIFSTKPQFAAGSTTLTPGTLTGGVPAVIAAGSLLRFKVTQIGSSVAGEKLHVAIEAYLTP